MVGRADAEWGQRVVAVIELADGQVAPTLDELREWVRAELPAWAAPKDVEVADPSPAPRWARSAGPSSADGNRPVRRQPWGVMSAPPSTTSV